MPVTGLKHYLVVRWEIKRKTSVYFEIYFDAIRIVDFVVQVESAAIKSNFWCALLSDNKDCWEYHIQMQ